MAQETSIRFKVETQDANAKVRRLEQEVNRLEVAVRKAGGSTKVVENSIRAFGKSAGAAEVSARSLGVAVKGVLGPLSLVATAVGAVVAGFRGFVAADKARAAVQTLGVNAKQLEDQLVGVVARTKGLASSNELLAASYDVASAGFSKAADISKILEASVLGAVGGMTDIATVSDAATSVMNAYGLSTDSVSKIVDGFIQTQNDGKIIVGQYAAQIGRVAPIAAAAGVGIDELNAAISTVTAQGVPVESTFSGINQVVASVVKPTAEAAKAAQQLGLDFSSAAIRTKGFGGFLADVIEKTGGSDVAITKLFGSVDALKALMPLISGDLEVFNKNLENQRQATGAAQDAADIMGETVSSQISRIVNSITTMVRSLDQVLGPAIKGVLDLINTVITAATNATNALTQMFRRNRAQQQARKEFGGRIGRGTFKGDETAIAERREEILAAANAASTPLKPETVEIPEGRSAAEILKLLQEQQKSRTVGAGKGRAGKTDEERQAEALERSLTASVERTQALKDQASLAGALTEEERRSVQLNIDLRKIVEDTKGLSGEVVNAEIAARIAVEDATDARQAGLEIQDKLKKAAEASAEAQRKAAEKMDNLYASIGQSIQSGIVDSLTAAVDGTKKLADVAADTLRNVANILLQFGVNTALGGLGSTGGILGKLFGGFKASGGSVSAGRSYVVGERGPELFTPGRSGSIAPSGSFGGAKVTVNVDASGTQVQGNQPNAKLLGQAIGAAVQAELIKQKRPGGLLAV